MPSLRELQDDVRRALLEGPVGDLAAAIADDGIAPDARLDIYRHHVVTSLTAVLESTFPIVCRLVDLRFFAYAADAFIRRHPPASPCLFEYGAELPSFLGEFPACRDLVYLADVARLEWAMNVATHAEDVVPLDPAALASVDPARVGELSFDFDPALSLLRSPWPIDRIWRANQAGAGDEPAVDLGAGGVCLEVRRQDDEVVFRELPEAAYALRSALLAGERLEAAAAAAFAVDATFDLAGALHALLQDGLLTRFTLSSTSKEAS